jgi:hypothetical protein
MLIVDFPFLSFNCADRVPGERSRFFFLCFVFFGIFRAMMAREAKISLLVIGQPSLRPFSGNYDPGKLPVLCLVRYIKLLNF